MIPKTIELLKVGHQSGTKVPLVAAITYTAGGMRAITESQQKVTTVIGHILRQGELLTTSEAHPLIKSKPTTGLHGVIESSDEINARQGTVNHF